MLKGGAGHRITTICKDMVLQGKISELEKLHAETEIVEAELDKASLEQDLEA